MTNSQNTILGQKIGDNCQETHLPTDVEKVYLFKK